MCENKKGKELKQHSSVTDRGSETDCAVLCQGRHKAVSILACSVLFDMKAISEDFLRGLVEQALSGSEDDPLEQNIISPCAQIQCTQILTLEIEAGDEEQ